jgi:hypothetical protein
MKNYIVYNDAGKILRTGSCPESDFDLQAREGEHVLEGQANDSTQEIVDGAVADIEGPIYESAESLRMQRDQKLTGTDWSQVADSALSDEDKQAYRDYRQALRNITNHANWPSLTDQDWPTLEI